MRVKIPPQLLHRLNLYARIRRELTHLEVLQMPKAKRQPSKHSRAARRSVEPDLEIETKPQSEHDGKTQVLEALAERDVRSSGADGSSGPALPKVKGGNVSKSGRNKRDKKRRERALLVRERLTEKVEQAKLRHKTVRTYRKKDESEVNEPPSK